jgi:hypothetical protein
METAWDLPVLGPLEGFAGTAWRAAASSVSRPVCDLIQLHMTRDYPSYWDAYAGLQKALADAPAAREFLATPTAACLLARTADGGWDAAPRLQALAPGAHDALLPQLQAFAAAAGNVHHFLHGLLEREEKPECMEMFRTLSCEAARLLAAAQALATLLELWDAAAHRKIDARSLKSCEALRSALLDALAVIENRRTKLTGPLKLSDLSPLFGLAEHLHAQIAEVVAGTRKPTSIEWAWKAAPAQTTP